MKQEWHFVLLILVISAGPGLVWRRFRWRRRRRRYSKRWYNHWGRRLEWLH
jgi:hypothetical protein